MLESMFLGTIAGALAGLLPGIGVFVSLVILYPFVVEMPLDNILVFYISLASTVQYMGSVSAIYFAVPGETTSVPAIKEGYKLNRHGLGQLAISSTAIGSIVGAAMAVLLTFVFAEILLDTLRLALKNSTKVVLYSVVTMCLFLFFNQKHKIVNVALITSAFLLAYVGTDPVDMVSTRLTLGISDLQYGIPLFPVLVGMMVVPTLLNTKQTSTKEYNIQSLPLAKHLAIVPRYTKTIIRSSTIGYFCGFVPGLTTILATNTAYNYEKSQKTSSVNRIVAAETANNSAQFTSFIPLLMIGIPITSSEAVIFNMAMNQNFDSYIWSEGKTILDLLSAIAPYFLLSNILALALAWPLSKKIAFVSKVPSRYITVSVLIICVSLSLFIGSGDLRALPYLFYTILFSIIGYVLRKYDTMPFVFMFVMGREIEYQLQIFTQLHF